MTKVIVLPGDLGGCGYYRCIWPAEALASLGHDVTWLHPDQHQIEFKAKRDLSGAILGTMPDCDVLVVQRPLHWYWKHLIPQMRARGIRVVGEIDDDFWNVHPHNDGWRHVHPSASPGHNSAHLRDALNECHRVTVSTPALARHFLHHPGLTVVRNYLPSAMVVPERVHTGTGSEVTVGWAGDTGTHIGDLASTQGAVGQAQRQTGFRFLLIGRHANKVKRDLDLKRPPEVHPWVPLAEYPEALSRLDIGLAPLVESDFNRSKSWLKPLEYMARGVPFVAAHSMEYIELVVGHQAPYSLTKNGRDDWAYYLRALVLSADLRTEWAARGIEIARSLTIERRTEEWLTAWGMD